MADEAADQGFLAALDDDDISIIRSDDGFGKQQFPNPPGSHSATALPTSFWLAVVGIFAQIICAMMFGGSDSFGALIASTIICTLIILAGTLDTLLNSDIAHKTTSLGLTFKIIGLCVAVGTVACGIVLFGWLFFSQDLNSEYRVNYARTIQRSQSVNHGVLPNGLKYSVRSNDFEKGLFTTILCVDSGSTNEDDNQRGLAHFLEHMAFDKSFHFPRRGQVYSEVMKFGADFNAFTNFRNTVYFFYKLDWSADNLKKALFLHKNQVLYQEPVERNINQERGAVLGEARLHNHTSRWAVNDLICNHFGKGHRSCERFPIGRPELIGQFRPTDFRAYLTKWYRLDKMRLIVVGDFENQEEEVVKAIRDQFANEPYLPGQDPEVKPDDVPIVPTSEVTPGRVFINEYPGLGGVDVHLMVTSEYETPMSSLDVVRRDTWNDVFAQVFKTQMLSRFGSMYPEQLMQGTGVTKASASVDMEWSFNATVYSLSISTPGKPHRSTWKRDIEVALKEIKNLAENGPDPDTVMNAMMDVKADMDSEITAQKTHSHEDMAMQLLGNLDPKYQHVDIEEESEIVSDFLSMSMADAVSMHVQTCAQILYRAALECTANKTYNTPPYNSLPAMRQSLNVFHGTTMTKNYLRKITAENIARIVASVHKHPADPVSTSGLQVMFMLPQLLGHKHSNTAQDLRDSDFLLNFPADPEAVKSGDFKLVEHSNATGVSRYVLSNGVGVNVRASREDETVPQGQAAMTVVALGGLATQPPSLKGACQFINTVKANGLSLAKAKAKDDADDESHLTAAPASRHCAIRHNLDVSIGRGRRPDECVVVEGGVHHPDTHGDSPPADGKGGKPGAGEGLGCESEFLKISVKLSPKCADDDECELATKDYTKQLHFALEEMRPQYDERTISLAHQEHERQLESLEMDLESDDVMRRSVMPGLVSAAFPADSRTQPVTVADLKALDPLEVNRWVREHFVVSRYEINVAGNVNVDNLIKQLDDMFGTLPLVNFTRQVDEDNITAGTLHQVGLDPYSAGDSPNFHRTFPKEKMRTSCVLKHAVPDHAHIVHTVPAGDFRSGGAPAVVRRLADRLLSRMIFLKIRRDNGYAYHVDINPRHSVIFPDFGYYELEWVAGKYSAHEGIPEFRGDLNVLGSSKAARDVFSEDIVDDVWDEVVNAYVQRINASYAEPDYWLRLMQGLSIHPPVTWPKPTVPEGQEPPVLPGLLKISDVDELEQLGTVTKAEVSQYLREHSWNPQAYLWGIVITRPRTYGLEATESECAFPTAIL